MKEINVDITLGEMLARDVELRCPCPDCGNKLGIVFKDIVPTIRWLQVEVTCPKHITQVGGIVQYEYGGKVSYTLRISDGE